MATLVLPTELPPYTRHDVPLNVAGPSTMVSSPPSYSMQPYQDEETVAFTPRVGNTTPHGTFTRSWPQATLILKDQEEGSRLPTYGRNGRVVGELGLKSTEKIVRVTVKLHGQMSLSVADSGSTGATLISETHVLWKHHPTDNPHEAGVEHRCPSILPIYIQFPGVYEAEGKLWRLPPSFEATFLGIPALFVRCMYTLSVTITRTRSYHLASWTTNKTYVTMVNFKPRTRPNRPIVLLDSVFASLKPVPEEWLQVEASMNVYPSSGMKPIECHLFIPSVQTYSITDTIPFHLQLCSTLQSLRELLPPTSTHLEVGENATTNIKMSDPRVAPAPYAIRLSIARQVVVEIHGRRRFRTFTIGVGKMWSVPPNVHHHHAGATWEEPGGASSAGASGEPKSNAAGDSDVCVDWQGEVKCWGEVSTGGFSASNLIVKDFLILALTPPNPRSSFLVPLQLSHPIRLVTDSWIDFDALHPRDHIAY